MSLFDELEPDNRIRSEKDGEDLRKKKDNKEHVAKKQLKKSPRHALKPGSMYFNQDEKDMFSEFYNRFKQDVIDKFGEFTTSQEVLVVGLCYAVMRLQRKSRLESNYGKFFDRVVSHDPLGQMNACMKSLGLLNEKKDTNVATGAQEIKKLLAQDSENADREITTNGYEEWLADRRAQGADTIKFRTPDVIPRYEEAEDPDGEELDTD